MTPPRGTLARQRRRPNPHPDDQAPLPRRPRRRWLNWPSALLAALVSCAVGFYAGVRVEKGQVGSTTPTSSLASATGARAGGLAAAAAGRGGASRGGAGGTATGRGGAGGAANASFGTVQSVSGRTLVLSEASGTTVEVRVSSSTKVSKTQSVKRSAVRPGDTIIVQGAPNAKGTLVAATVTDSGAGLAGAGASRSSAGSGQSAGSAVGSLFSSGG